MSMTFDTLVASKTTAGSIKSWQNYSKIDAEGVLSEAEDMIFTRLRVREMRASETITVRVAASTCDLPDGFLDPLKLRDITNDCTLVPKSEEELEDIRSWTDGILDSGDPSYFAIFDEAFQFDCKTSTQWKARTLFYKKPDRLGTGNQRNFLTDRYSHVLRMACLATGARFAHDDALFQREQRLLFGEIDEINARDELSRRGQDNPVT